MLYRGRHGGAIECINLELSVFPQVSMISFTVCAYYYDMLVVKNWRERNENDGER